MAATAKEITVLVRGLAVVGLIIQYVITIVAAVGVIKIIVYVNGLVLVV